MQGRPWQSSSQSFFSRQSFIPDSSFTERRRFEQTPYFSQQQRNFNDDFHSKRRRYDEPQDFFKSSSYEFPMGHVSGSNRFSPDQPSIDMKCPKCNFEAYSIGEFRQHLDFHIEDLKIQTRIHANNAPPSSNYDWPNRFSGSTYQNEQYSNQLPFSNRGIKRSFHQSTNNFGKKVTNTQYWSSSQPISNRGIKRPFIKSKNNFGKKDTNKQHLSSSQSPKSNKIEALSSSTSNGKSISNKDMCLSKISGFFCTVCKEFMYKEDDMRSDQQISKHVKSFFHRQNFFKREKEAKQDKEFEINDVKPNKMEDDEREEKLAEAKEIESCILEQDQNREEDIKQGEKFEKNDEEPAKKEEDEKGEKSTE